MRLSPQSLRGKVVLGYFAGFLLMSGLVFVNWRNLRHLQEIVAASELVSRFFDTTLEARRYEKNFFLYSQGEDFRELLRFSEEAHRLLSGGRRTFGLFTDAEILSHLEENLERYLDLLSRGRRLPPEEQTVWEGEVRTRGQNIVGIAEELSRTQHRVVRKSLGVSRTMLLASVAVVIALGLALSTVFLRLFIRPLELIERHMSRIAAGDLSLIPFRSQDRELVSLNRAFSRMLHEIDLRQQHLVRSEKLASFGTLLFGVAHELNNPLSNIYSSSQILAEEIEEADTGYQKELITQIESESERAKDIVRALLDFSRKRNRERVELLPAVFEAVRFIRGDLPPKIDLEVSVPAGLFLTADRQGLQQAFLNLIKNSIEAMPGEGKIAIRARRTAGGSVEIVFTDTGPGISPEEQKKMFDPFFTTKERSKGSGLGLFIVHNIVTEHRGTIRVESEPGYGATIIIDLPGEERNAPPAAEAGGEGDGHGA